MLRIPFALMLFLAPLLLSPSAARATPVTVVFSGTVASVVDNDGTLGGAVAVGDPFSGTYTIDPAAVGVPGTGLDGITGTVYQGPSIEVSAGTLPSFSSPVEILVANDEPSGSLVADFITVLGGQGSVSDPDHLLFGFALIDSSGTALTDESLVVAPDLAAFDATEADILEVANSMQVFDVFARVDSITVVPEPATAILLGLGLTALALHRPSARARPV